MLSVKGMITRLVVGLIKKISLYKIKYYPEPDNDIRNKI